MTERQREYQRKYRLLNKEMVDNKRREYVKKNRESLNKKRREWKIKNKDAFEKTRRSYYLKTKESQLKYGKKYRQENKELVSKKRKERYKKNIAKETAYRIEWMKKFAHKKLENGREYYKKYPEKKKIQRANRIGIDKITPEQIVSLGIIQKWKCFYCDVDCKESYHIDHYMPFCLGGLNKIENIVISCAKCNLKKHTKHPELFLEIINQNGK